MIKDDIISNLQEEIEELRQEINDKENMINDNERIIFELKKELENVILKNDLIY